MKYIKTFNEASKFQEEISKLNKKFISDKYDIMESNKKIIEDCFLHVSDLCKTDIETHSSAIDTFYSVDINLLDLLDNNLDKFTQLYTLIEESLEKCYLDLDIHTSIHVMKTFKSIQTNNTNTSSTRFELKDLKRLLESDKLDQILHLRTSVSDITIRIQIF